jgi:cytochrome c-type biogenesis protein CcmH
MNSKFSKLLQFLSYVYLALFIHIAHADEATPLATDPALEQRLISISEEMRCLVCQNESLSGSRSELAQDLRREIRDLIKQGKTDAEIRTFMVDRYGDFILYRPPVKPTTWLLWIGPFVLMFAGIVALLMYLRRRNTQVITTSLSDDENKRIDALLRDDK